MKEKERKFLFLRNKINPSVFDKHGDLLCQGYLMLTDNRQLRIRLIHRRFDNDIAMLCYKNHISSNERNEYEYEIPIKDGVELYASCLDRLKKIRYTTEFQGNHVDIDCYPSGLEVVEIEYIEDLVELPDYCGEEITNNEQYSNFTLAKLGKEI